MKRYKVTATAIVEAETEDEATARFNCAETLTDYDFTATAEHRYDDTWLPEPMRGPLGRIWFCDFGEPRHMTVTYRQRVYVTNGHAAFLALGPVEQVHKDNGTRDDLWSEDVGVTVEPGKRYERNGFRCVHFGYASAQADYVDAAHEMYGDRGRWLSDRARDLLVYVVDGTPVALVKECRDGR